MGILNLNCNMLFRHPNQSIKLISRFNVFGSFPRAQKFSFRSDTHDNTKFSFMYIKNDNESAKKFLKIYSEKGLLIRKYPSPEFEALEDIIVNFSECKMVQESARMFPKHGDLSRFFVALTAPSLTGKTQLAFSFSKKLPLYFVFSHSQDIYSNFYQISDELRINSEYDLQKLRIRIGSLEDNIIKMDHLSGAVLNFKFRTLGFILCLINDAERNFPHSTENSWMEFFANRSQEQRKKIEFESVSIAEFKNHPMYKKFIEKYFVFLDEFSGRPELVLIRNFCRILQLTCVVASTNCKVANLVGLTKMSGSGSSLPSAWAVVVPQLPPITQEVLNFSSSIENDLAILIQLASNFSTEEAIRMNKFLNYIKENQFKHSRSGVVAFIANAIHKIVNQQPQTKTSLTLDEFFESFLRELSEQIRYRKTSAFNDVDGIKANVKLLWSNSYENLYHFGIDSDDKSFMVDKHFYFLKSPYKDQSKPFLLYNIGDYTDPSFIKFTSNHNPAPFELSLQCFFKKDEELLLLACMITPTRFSTSKSLFSNLQKLPMGEIPNFKAIKKSGLEQENLALASIIDSSHFSDEFPYGTFRGVTLDHFLSNMLNNFNLNLKKIRDERPDILLNFSENTELEHTIKALKIPFLFPADISLPSIYEDLFPRGIGPIHIGCYHRAPDSYGIDGFFDILQNELPATAIMESKNCSDSLILSNYLEIIMKGLNFKQSPTLHLTFCRSASDFNNSRKVTISKFKKLSKDRNINFLRLEALPNKAYGFNIVPALNEVKIYSKPSMTALIIELDVIDDVFNSKK